MRVSERVAVRVETRTTGRVQELAALVASLQQQVTQLVPSIHALGILDSNIELFASADDALHEIRVQGVQLELLKAQLMAFERTLDDLGRAIAPDAGIAAAPHRFAELRDQIQRLDRAVRSRPTAEPPRLCPQRPPLLPPRRTSESGRARRLRLRGLRATGSAATLPRSR